jgi:protein-disulfide isomerase
MVYSLAAIVLAAVVVGGALVMTSGSNQTKPIVAPFAPQASILTPSSIHTDGLTLGDANAPHTLDLWEDYQCPHCADFTRDAEPQIVANFVATGKLKLVYHDFLVIDATGTESVDAANAARCAADQGLFWPYHDWLFTNQYSENSGAYTKDRLKTIGQMMGIKDVATFNSCVDNGTHNTEIKNEQSQVSSSWQGTPTLIVDGGSPLSSYDYDTVVAAINQALGISPSPSAGSSGSASAAPAASASASAS